ncbi:class I SAM-dependent methyltransferase [Candidatus Roizmanbacteria bacterium]|nr:class I SAM-dependent methyltransferase [Candidatus Roizmanbacteria bacterium]
MKCLICGEKNVRKLKVVDSVQIFECKNCDLGFINQDVQRRTIDYDFEGYRLGEKNLRKRFDLLAGTLSQFKSRGDVLDVGGGFGLFSSILNQKGNYTIDILEPSLTPYYLRGTPARVIKNRYEDFIKGKRGKYDLILMMDVLEHFKNPLKNIKKAKNLLAKDGLLVIQTPNYKSLMAKLCRKWAWWMVEDHKFFFSPKSIALFLKKAGFKIEYFTSYEDWLDFKKNLDGNFTNIKNDLVRKTIKGAFFGLFIPFYFLLRQTLWKLHKGGLQFVIVQQRRGAV